MLYWQATCRTYIHSTYNITEAMEFVTDLYRDAHTYVARHNHSLELVHASQISGRFARTVRTVREAALAEDNRSKKRLKRNILGTLLHDITGLATSEEIAVENTRINKLKDEVKVLANHEYSLYSVVEELQNRVKFTETEIMNLLGHLRWTIQMDGLYHARKVGGCRGRVGGGGGGNRAQAWGCRLPPCPAWPRLAPHLSVI